MLLHGCCGSGSILSNNCPCRAVHPGRRTHPVLRLRRLPVSPAHERPLLTGSQNVALLLACAPEPCIASSALAVPCRTQRKFYHEQSVHLRASAANLCDATHSGSALACSFNVMRHMGRCGCGLPSASWCKAIFARSLLMRPSAAPGVGVRFSQPLNNALLCCFCLASGLSGSEKLRQA